MTQTRLKIHFFNILPALVFLTSIVFLVISILPFGTLKSLADSWVGEGNFNSLKESNSYIFRILLGLVGLLLLVVAYSIQTGRYKDASSWVSQYFASFKEFLKVFTTSRMDNASIVVLVAIVVTAIPFRLFYLYDPISHDEGYTFVVFSSTSLFNTLTNYHLPNNHILNSLLIYFSTHIFGIQPWAVRLPALLAGLLLIPATYLAAKAIFDKYTGWLSAILVAVLPGAVYYSRNGRGYSLVALFTMLALVMAIYVRSHKNWFAWSLLVVFSALGFYSVPIMLFPFGAIFTWLFLDNLVKQPEAYGSKANFLKYCTLAGICTAALVLLLYTPVFIYSGADKVFMNQFVRPEIGSGYIASLPGYIQATWRDWTAGMADIWKMVLLAGFFLGLTFHSRISNQRFPLQIAAFLWFIALILIQRPEHHTKVWVFWQAPTMIWSAAGLIGLVKTFHLKYIRSEQLAAAVIGIVLAVTALRAVQIAPSIPARWAEKGAIEETVLSIKDQLNPKDLIIIDAPFDAVLWYYARLYGLSESRFYQNLPFERLFVVVTRSNGQTLQSVLQNRGPDIDLIDLEGARLILNHQYLDTYIVSHR